MKLDQIDKYSAEFKNSITGKRTEIEIYNKLKSITVCTEEKTDLNWYRQMMNILEEKNEKLKSGSYNLDHHTIKIIKV